MAKNASEKEEHRIVASNRRASTRYEIVESMEAGVVLTGPEVKSVRAGNVNLSDGFARIDGEEVFLWNVHIAPYNMGSLHVTQDPMRKRKLLLKRTEINRWLGKTTVKGLTIIPLEIYFNKRGIAKVKIALAKGRRGPDQREEIKRKQVGRELQREFTGKHRVR
jgi:SsrA-binding protein